MTADRREFTARSADGVTLACREEGDPDGPTVVLVHGWPDSHVLWDGVVPLLADRFRVIRYDNRGVGGSGAPKATSAHAMARYADDLAAVLDAASPRTPCTSSPTTGARSACGNSSPARRRRPASRWARRSISTSTKAPAPSIVRARSARRSAPLRISAKAWR